MRRAILVCCTVAALGFVAAARSAELFTEDYSSATLLDSENGYVGGWYGSLIGFDQWYGSSTAVSTSSGALTVIDQTASYRSAGIILGPELFGGEAQTLVLRFDVVSLTLFPDDAGVELGDTHNAEVKVWSGEGYDLSSESGDAIFADSLGGTFSGEGNAAVQFLTSTQVTSAGTGYTTTFDYDGSSCIGFFFGANRDSWPDIEVTYDNISVSPVPEPTTGVLLGLLLATVAGRRLGRVRSDC